MRHIIVDLTELEPFCIKYLIGNDELLIITVLLYLIASCESILLGDRDIPRSQHRKTSINIGDVSQLINKCIFFLVSIQNCV